MFALRNICTRSMSTRIIHNATAATSLKLTQRKFSVNRTLYQSNFDNCAKEISGIFKYIKEGNNKVAKIAVSLKN
jgi:hypothetical protein